MNDSSTTGLRALDLDAKVSFDDLVNVFVSRHEEQLHQQRQKIQADMKTIQAARVDLVKQIKQDVISGFWAQTDDTFTNGLITTTYKIDVADNAEPSDKDTIQATITMQHNVVFNDNRYDSTPKNTVTVALPIDAPLLGQLRQLNDQHQVLRDNLILINGEIQAIDRKTRQIKGLLAEKKLKAEGMEDLLNNQDIANILQLPSTT